MACRRVTVDQEGVLLIYQGGLLAYRGHGVQGCLTGRPGIFLIEQGHDGGGGGSSG